MKKILFLLTLCVALISCGNDEPQEKKYDKVEGHLYKAVYYEEAKSLGRYVEFKSNGIYSYTIDGENYHTNENYEYVQTDEFIVIKQRNSNRVYSILEAFDGKIVDWDSRDIYERVE